MRPSKFEDVSNLCAGTVYGTNDTIWWTRGSKEPSGVSLDDFAYHCKKKEMEPLKHVIIFGNGVITEGEERLQLGLYYGELHVFGCTAPFAGGGSISTSGWGRYDTLIEPLGHFFDRKRNCQSQTVHESYTFTSVLGYICRDLRLSELYFLPLSEVEERVESAFSVEASSKVTKRKEDKQKLVMGRKKKDKKFSKAKRRTSYAKMQQHMV